MSNPAFTDFETRHRLTLNEMQREAVRTVEGPVLLTAVPGSGKTTVLICRIGYMTEVCGIDPGSILTVTYTKAATADMRRRFLDRFGGVPDAKKVRFSTINALCFGVIGEYARTVSKRAPFELLPEDRARGLLQSLWIETQREYPTQGELKELQKRISYAKNSMLTESELKTLDSDGIPFSALCKRYNDSLVESRHMDYDDQMVYTLRLFKKYPALLERYRRRYRYILVDEAQDTSRIQHELLYLLAGETRNLFMVGDEDQSIYGFRAAYPEALLRFETRFPGAKLLFLEQNYRSSSEIVACADALIRRNKSRREKRMTPARSAGGGSTLRIVPLRSAAAQYAYLLKLADTCRGETAILYRDNESALPLIDLLRAKGIPFSLRRSDDSFFEHRTVRDLTDLLGLALDPADVSRFARVWPRLGLYIQKEQALKAIDEAKQTGRAVTEVLLAMPLSRFQAGKVKALQTQLKNMRGQPAGTALYKLIRFSGYAEYLQRQQAQSRKPEILEMLADGAGGISDFLDKLERLRAFVNEAKPDETAPLILSTIHSAKGLEFDSVCLLDVFDGVLPAPGGDGANAKALAAEAEEERRLFYVAVTRAKNRLTVFELADRPADFVSELKRAAGLTAQNSAAPKGFAAGERVRHISFGPGTVLRNLPAEDVIEIRFDDGRTRSLSASFCKKKRLLRPAET